MKCYIYGTICKIAIVKLGNCCALLIIVLFLTLIARLKWLWNIHKIYETEGKFFLFEIQTRVNSITSPLLRDTGVFVNHVLSKQFDFCVSLTNCWIKFMAMEKVNNKVCDTHNESLYYTHKNITSFGAGYSSKTTAQQLPVVVWAVLIIFVHYLDKES